MKSTILLGISLLASIAAMGQQQVSKDSLETKKMQLTAKKSAANKESLKQKEKQNTTLRVDRSQQIARKMTDSLELSQTQRADIININTSLEQQKALVFRSDTNRTNITRELQQIEHQRDNMYRSVLTEKQFKIYEKSKMNLINPTSKRS